MRQRTIERPSGQALERRWRFCARERAQASNERRADAHAPARRYLPARTIGNALPLLLALFLVALLLVLALPFVGLAGGRLGLFVRRFCFGCPLSLERRGLTAATGGPRSGCFATGTGSGFAGAAGGRRSISFATGAASGFAGAAGGRRSISFATGAASVSPGQQGDDVPLCDRGRFGFRLLRWLQRYRCGTCDLRLGGGRSRRNRCIALLALATLFHLCARFRWPCSRSRLRDSRRGSSLRRRCNRCAGRIALLALAALFHLCTRFRRPCNHSRLRDSRRRGALRRRCNRRAGRRRQPEHPCARPICRDRQALWQPLRPAGVAPSVALPSAGRRP